MSLISGESFRTNKYGGGLGYYSPQIILSRDGDSPDLLLSADAATLPIEAGAWGVPFRHTPRHVLEHPCGKVGQRQPVPLRRSPVSEIRASHQHHCNWSLTQKRVILETDCDILALQEVDPTKSFFDFLTEAGY